MALNLRFAQAPTLAYQMCFLVPFALKTVKLDRILTINL